MPVGPFRRLISRGPGIRGDIVREGHINQIYDALETMPAFADLQSPVSIVGTGPLASRPASASEGEAYIAVDGGVSTVYIWSDGAWVDGGTLQGPEGPKGDTGAQGARGEKGDTGDTGPAGDPGEGVPVGGATGQVLAKASGADLDAEWVDPSGDGTQAGETTGNAVAGIVLDNGDGTAKETWLGTTKDGGPPSYAISKLNEAGFGAGDVASVNGQTGVVVLDADDVGALPGVNVRAYGAAGDGVTDDSAAFTAANLALAAQGGGTLHIPAGAYRGRFAIDQDNVTWRGEGMGNTVLKLPDATNVPAQVLTITGNGAQVLDLQVNGNKDAHTIVGNTRASDGISVYANDVLIQRVHVKDAVAHGIIVWNEATSSSNGAANATAAAGSREYPRILDSTIENNGIATEPRASIDLAAGNTTRRAIVSRNIIRCGSYSQTGVTCHSGSRAIISNNLVMSPNDACFKPHTGATDVIITGNIALSDGAKFLSTAGGGDVGRLVITDNIAAPLTLASTTGMVIFASFTGNVSDVVMTGNIYRASGSARLAYFASGTNSNMLIAHNLMHASGSISALIRVDPAATQANIRVFGNLLSDVANTILLDTGATSAGISMDGLPVTGASDTDKLTSLIAALASSGVIDDQTT